MVSVDVKIAGVRGVGGLIEKRRVSVIIDSSTLHVTIADTGDVTESGRTAAQVRLRDSPPVTFLDGTCAIITLLGGGTE